MFPDAAAKTHACLNVTSLWVSLHSLVFQFFPTLVLKSGNICSEYDQNIISFFVKEDTYLISFLFVFFPKGFECIPRPFLSKKAQQTEMGVVMTKINNLELHLVLLFSQPPYYAHCSV